MSQDITLPKKAGDQSAAQVPGDERLKEIRSRISDLGFEIDAAKASAGLMMGAGVFLTLLAALAFYDLFSGKAGVWLAVGITRDTLNWVAYGCGGVGVALIIQTLLRRLRRDRATEAELAGLEEEYARLIESKDSSGGE